MSTEEQKRKEAERILYECYCAELEIQSREGWTLEEVEQVQEDTFQNLLKTGLNEEEITKIADLIWASDDFNNPAQKYLTRIANILYKNYPQKPPSLKELSEKISDIKADNLEYIERQAQGEDKQRADADREGLLQVCNGIERQIKQIKKLTIIERKRSVAELWENFIKHEGGLYKTVPAKLLGQTDLKKARDLSLTTSEQPFINLGRQIQRGRFQPQDGFENPIADISGTVDTGEYQKNKKNKNKHPLNITAELAPKQHEGSEVVRAIAEKWAEPLSNLGPKTDASLAAVEAFWIKRKNSKGELTLKIQDIAEAIGYAPQKDGSFKSGALDTVREAVRGIARLEIIIRPQIIRGEEIRGQQALLDIEYVEFKKNQPPRVESGNESQYIGKGEDKPEYNWNIIIIRPNSFFRAVVGKGLTKAVDFTIYKLDSIHQRRELYLADYLQTIWRISWTRERGTKTLMIRTLLHEGMDYRNLETVKRKRTVIESLEKALEKLQEMGNIGYFEYPIEYVELIDNKGGKRITRRLFDKILDLKVYIEAGAKYKEHYNEKLNPPKLNEITQELQDYLIKTGTTNAMAAEMLGVTTKTVNNWLSNKNKPSHKKEQQIQDLLDGKNINLSLF